MTDSSQLACRRPTHQSGGTLDLVLTNVPELCQGSVGPSVGRSDHSALFLMLKLVEPALHFDLAFSVPLLSKVKWRGVSDALSSIGGAPFSRAPSMINNLDNQFSDVLLRFCADSHS